MPLSDFQFDQECGTLFGSMSESKLARAAFHEPHLLRVSRSFAYGIGRLEVGLRANVGLGYLLCRILDTVEDAVWATPLQQLDAFEKFEWFLSSRIDAAKVNEWVATFPTSIPEGEQLLLRDSVRIFDEFHSLSADEKSAMRQPIRSMAAGMRFFTESTRENGFLKFNSLIETNAYCLFVAGVVGELLTGLVALEAEMPNDVYRDGCHFGLFLQKINILKDQWADESEGRFFVSNREELLASIRVHAEHALRYLLSVPTVRADYRLFCAWALYLGLATVPLLETAKREDSEPAKLSRTRALFLGGKIELAIRDDKKLKEIFDSLVDESTVLSRSAPMKHNSSSAADVEFDVGVGLGDLDLGEAEGVLDAALELYEGSLSDSELVRILVVD